MAFAVVTHVATQQLAVCGCRTALTVMMPAVAGPATTSASGSRMWFRMRAAGASDCSGSSGCADPVLVAAVVWRTDGLRVDAENMPFSFGAAGSLFAGWLLVECQFPAGPGDAVGAAFADGVGGGVVDVLRPDAAF